MNYKEFLVTYKKPLLIGLGAIALLLLVLFVADRMSDHNTDKYVEKKKQAITNNVQGINAVQGQIDVLEGRKQQMKEEIVADTKELMNSVNAHVEAKEATNQAIANFQKALNANTDIQRSAYDIEQKLKELEGR